MVEKEVEKGWREGNRREKSGREGCTQRRRERKYVERDGKGRDEVERSRVEGVGRNRKMRRRGPV
jgi:hypothetical protein